MAEFEGGAAGPTTAAAAAIDHVNLAAALAVLRRGGALLQQRPRPEPQRARRSPAPTGLVRSQVVRTADGVVPAAAQRRAAARGPARRLPAARRLLHRRRRRRRPARPATAGCGSWPSRQLLRRPAGPLRPRRRRRSRSCAELGLLYDRDGTGEFTHFYTEHRRRGLLRGRPAPRRLRRVRRPQRPRPAGRPAPAYLTNRPSTRLRRTMGAHRVSRVLEVGSARRSWRTRKAPPVSPLASYRRLFELAGPTYVVVAFLARLPLAMSQLGTLLLVSDATGSYGLGGLVRRSARRRQRDRRPVRRLARRPDRAAPRRARPGPRRRRVARPAGRPGARRRLRRRPWSGRPPWPVSTMPQVGPLARVALAADHRAAPAPSSGASSMSPSPTRVPPTRRPSRSAPPWSVSASSRSRPSGALLLAAGLLATFGTAFALHRTAAVARQRRRPAHRSAGDPGAARAGRPRSC